MRRFPKRNYTKKAEGPKKEIVFDFPFTAEQTAAHVAMVETLKSPKASYVFTAVAGSGKTSGVILGGMKAVEAALTGTEFLPNKVLLTSFAKLITNELASYKFPEWVHVQGLHSLGYAAIRNAYGKVKSDPRKWDKLITADANFNPWNAEEGKAKAKAFMRMNGAKDLMHYAAVTVADWNDDKVLLELAANFQVEMNDSVDLILACVKRCMKAALAMTDVINFDEMLYWPVYHDMDLPKFDMIVGDECQDFSIVMHQLLQKMTNRFIGVGDRFQAIYAFSGASCNSVDELKEAFDAEELNLTYNFRCARSIVEFAQKLNPMIQPWDGAPEGEVVENAPIDWIMSEWKVGDLVLARRRAEMSAAAFAAYRQGHPVAIRGEGLNKMLKNLAIRIFGRTNYDQEAGLELVNEWETKEFERAAKRGMSSAYIDLIADKAACLTEFLGQVTETEMLPAFIDKMVSATNKTDAGVINFMTAHASKGLENDTVFVLNYNGFKCAHPKMTKEQGKQELHLEYVAVTRAKSRLILEFIEPKKKA